MIQGAIAGSLENPLSRSADFFSRFLQENPVKATVNLARDTLTSLGVPGIVYEGALATNPNIAVTEKGIGSVPERIDSRLPGVRGGMQVRTDALGQVLDRTFGEEGAWLRGQQRQPHSEAARRPQGGLPENRRLAKRDDAKYGADSKPDSRYDRNESDYQYRVAFVGSKVQAGLEEVFNDSAWQKDYDHALELKKLGKHEELEGMRSFLKSYLKQVKKEANQELDDMRMRLGYDKAHTEAWKYVESKQVGKPRKISSR